MSKQDRQGARTPADLERKYDFGQTLTNLEAVVLKQNAQIETQSSKLNNFDSFAYETGNDVAGLEKDVSTLKRNVTKLQTRMTNAEMEDIKIKQSVANLDQRISALESHVKKLDTRLVTAETTLADLVARVIALESV